MLCFISSVLKAVIPGLIGSEKDHLGQDSVSCWFLASELSLVSILGTVSHLPVQGRLCHLLC